MTMKATYIVLVLALCGCSFPRVAGTPTDKHLFWVKEPQRVEGSDISASVRGIPGQFEFPVEWRRLRFLAPAEKEQTGTRDLPYTHVIYLEEQQSAPLPASAPLVALSQWRADMVSAVTMTVSGIGEERAALIEGSPETRPSRKAFVLTDSGRLVVGSLTSDAIFLQVQIHTYDPAARRGTLSVEYVEGERGQVVAHAYAQKIPFRPNQVMEFRRGECVVPAK